MVAPGRCGPNRQGPERILLVRAALVVGLVGFGRGLGVEPLAGLCHIGERVAESIGPTEILCLFGGFPVQGRSEATHKNWSSGGLRKLLDNIQWTKTP